MYGTIQRPDVGNLPPAKALYLLILWLEANHGVTDSLYDIPRAV